MLTNYDFSDAISGSDLQNFLNGDIIPEAAITRDDELLLCVWNDSEDGGYEVFEVVLLL